MNKATLSKRKTDQRLDDLERLPGNKPLVVFQFDEQDWSRLRKSRRDGNEFTIGRSHEPGPRQLELVDYPGEWLVDLSMLGESYEAWSEHMLSLASEESRAALGDQHHSELAALAIQQQTAHSWPMGTTRHDIGRISAPQHPLIRSPDHPLRVGKRP